jgi:hypothetical protein
MMSRCLIIGASMVSGIALSWIARVPATLTIGGVERPMCFPIQAAGRRDGQRRGDSQYPDANRKVFLDAGLAQVYGVTTRRHNEQVKPNHDCFPEDFIVRLSLEEGKSIPVLRSQFATSKSGKHASAMPK